MHRSSMPSTVECAVDCSSVLLVTARVKGEDVKYCKGPEGSVFGSSVQQYNGCVCGGESDSVTGFVGRRYFCCSIVCPCIISHSACLTNCLSTKSKHNRYTVSFQRVACFGTPAVPSSGKRVNTSSFFEFAQCIKHRIGPVYKHSIGPMYKALNWSSLVQCIKHRIGPLYKAQYWANV